MQHVPAATPLLHRERVLLAWVLAAVLVAHIGSFLYLSSLSAHNPNVPVYPVVAGDSANYALLADNLIQHQVFSDSPDLAPMRVWSPGYPLFLAAVKEITGSFTPAIFLQTALALLSAFLLYGMARRFVPSPLAALVVLLYGVDPMMVFADTAILTDGLFTALLIISIYLGFFQSRLRAPVRWGIIGLLLGGATLIRPIGQFLLVLLPAAYVVREWLRSREERTPQTIAALCAFVVCAALVVVPWVERNHAVFGSYEIAHSGPYNVLNYDVRDFLVWKEMEKTGPTSVFFPARHVDDPVFAVADREIAEEFARVTPVGANEDNYDGTVILHFILEDPIGYTYFHALNIVPFFLSGSASAYLQIVHQERDTADFSVSTLNTLQTALGEMRNPETFAPALSIVVPIAAEILWMCLLCILALCGLGFGRRYFETFLFGGLVAYFALLTGALALARYRIPAEPFLLLLAAMGASGIASATERCIGATRYTLLKKVVRYLISGGTGFGINISLYAFFVFQGMWYVGASVLGFGGALIVSFALQKFFAFRDNSPPRHGQQFAGYFLLMLCNICANAVLLFLLVTFAHAGKFTGLVISNIIIAVWSYFVYERLIFAPVPVIPIDSGGSGTLSDISIVIPCYNEEKSVGLVIDSVPKGVREIVVVDNNSSDQSGQVARAHGARVVVEKRQGYGAALACGFLSAEGTFIIAFDADNQYPANEIPHLLDFLVSRNLDFVSASRFPLSAHESMNLLRRVGNWGLTLAANFLFGLSLSDSQSGMWLFKRSVLPRILPTSDDMPFSQELKIRAARDRTIRFAEYHIPYRVRIGESKLFPFRHGIKLLIALFVLRFRK